jgi:hypothetical protein
VSPTQTIRADRKRHARDGEALQLYTAMRTRQCRLIGTAVCFGTVPIRIDLPDNTVTVGGAVYSGWDKLDPFARQDGFDGWLSMREFWRTTHGDGAFSGVLIRWGALEAANA